MSGIGTEAISNRTLGLAQKIAERHSINTKFGTTDALVDVGLSSLDLVNLMIAVEAEFNIMIPPALLNPKNFYSIETIAHMVEKVVVS